MAQFQLAELKQQENFLMHQLSGFPGPSGQPSTPQMPAASQATASTSDHPEVASHPRAPSQQPSAPQVQPQLETSAVSMAAAQPRMQTATKPSIPAWSSIVQSASGAPKLEQPQTLNTVEIQQKQLRDLQQQQEQLQQLQQQQASVALAEPVVTASEPFEGIKTSAAETIVATSAPQPVPLPQQSLASVQPAVSTSAPQSSKTEQLASDAGRTPQAASSPKLSKKQQAAANKLAAKAASNSATIQPSSGPTSTQVRYYH